MSRASILPQLSGTLAIGLLALGALPNHAAAEPEQCDVPFRHDTIRMMPESFDRNTASESFSTPVTALILSVQQGENFRNMRAIALILQTAMTSSRMS
jgi:hypothetical protein